MNHPAPLPLNAPAAPAWRSDLWLRVRRHLALKILGVSAFMWIFFLGYFHTLRHPVNPVTVMPLTALDRLLPFQPEALVAYVSLWFYIGIAPGLLLRLRELVLYGAWAAALCLTGLLCFYLWPTAVPPHGLDVSGYLGFAMLQGVDAAGNACPSLHVATAVFTALWVERLLRRARAPLPLRVLNGAWVLAIAWSTVAIRQHVVLDAVAGTALGLAFAGLSIRWSGGVIGRAEP